MSSKVHLMEESPMNTANVSMFDNTLMEGPSQGSDVTVNPNQSGEGGLDDEPRSDAAANLNQMEERELADQPKIDTTANPNQIEEGDSADQPRTDATANVPGPTPVGGSQPRKLGSCRKCNLIFTSTLDMNAHREETKHQPRIKVACAHCPLEVANLKDHTRRVHPEKMEICPVPGCFMDFVPGHGLRRHLKSRHSGESWEPVEPNVAPEPVASGTTEKPATAAPDVTKPLEHDVESGDLLGDPGHQSPQGGSKKVQHPGVSSQVACPVCGKGFLNQEYVNLHRELYHQACKDCNKMYNTKTLLNRHRKTCRAAAGGEGSMIEGPSPVPAGRGKKRGNKRSAEDVTSSPSKRVSGESDEDDVEAVAVDESEMESTTSEVIEIDSPDVPTTSAYATAANPNGVTVDDYNDLVRDYNTAKKDNKSLLSQFRQEKADHKCTEELYQEVARELTVAKRTIALLRKQAASKVKCESETLEG